MNSIADIGKLFISKNTEDPAINLNCSEFEVNNWIISDFIIKKLVPVVGIKPYPLTEQVLMVAAVCRFKPSHIFEWGTNVGISARIFYETLRYFQIESKIHSIDLPEDIDHIEHPRKKRAILIKNIHEINLHQGDGLEVSMSIFKNLQSCNNPLFFLDGDHSYQSVKRELEGILMYCDNPVILMHDTFFQSAESRYNIGPYKAIEEIIFANEKHFKIVSMNSGLPGMTLIFNTKNLSMH